MAPLRESDDVGAAASPPPPPASADVRRRRHPHMALWMLLLQVAGRDVPSAAAFAFFGGPPSWRHPSRAAGGAETGQPRRPDRLVPWRTGRFSASPTDLGMVQNLFGGGNGGTGGAAADQSLPSLPRDVKAAVADCRRAVQAALAERTSRMAVEFPVGTRFGVEKAGKKKRAVENGGDRTPTLEDLQRSDRELTRLFVEMFQPVGGDNIAVAFRDAEGADTARKMWRDDATCQCRVLSMDQRRVRRQQKKQAASGKGFAAKIAVELADLDQEGDGGSDGASSSGPFQLPANTEVALFVAPSQKELVTIEKICAQVGMGTLVVLLNARLGPDTRFASPAAEQLFRAEFDPVFCLTAAPQAAAPNCLLFRAYPGDWVLARKPRVGPPVSILVTPERPTPEACGEAFAAVQVSDVEKGIEGVVDTLSGWLK